MYNYRIVFEGKSLYDSQPIVVIGTGFVMGTNSKLGSNFITLYVFRSDIEPNAAKKTGDDKSVCLDCKFRQGVCYVTRPFYTLWQRYQQGMPKLDQMTLDTMRVQKRFLRLTGYGEITVVPFDEIEPLIENAKAVLGYTHTWKSDLALPYKPYLMASVQTEAEAIEAQSLGWKTFRVKHPNDPLKEGEIHCPEQRIYGKQCQTCLLCNGSRANVAIDIHGSAPKIANFRRIYPPN